MLVTIDTFEIGGCGEHRVGCDADIHINNTSGVPPIGVKHHVSKGRHFGQQI